MNILFEYIIVFLQIYIVAIFISGCGYLLKKQIFNLDEKFSFENNILWGFILISFILYNCYVISYLSWLVRCSGLPNWTTSRACMCAK